MNANSSHRETIIIIGGGVAGLMAARLLLKQGHVVTILEASERLGGRVHTVRDPSFSHPVERGTEFIHGDLPLTMQILRDGAIDCTPVHGKMFRNVHGEWNTQDDFAIGWDRLMIRMNELRQDMTISDFLESYFGGEKYTELRTSVLRFAEGFDLADPTRASILALREEWMEEGPQFRIRGGHDQLVNCLEKDCRELGAIIQTRHRVSRIRWKKNDVTVVTDDNQVYNGNKIIVTIALGLLQAEPSPIAFDPPVSHYMQAARKIGYGPVIKVILQFSEAFWEEHKKNIGFLVTNEEVPTWWTQRPSDYPLLTGWAGGPQALKMQAKHDDEILGIALRSLSNVFKKAVTELQRLLTASMVANWGNDPYSKGGYSFSTLESSSAQNLFKVPIDDTIFFAGEAFYDGSSPGTIEAALVSAKNAAERVSCES